MRTAERNYNRATGLKTIKNLRTRIENIEREIDKLDNKYEKRKNRVEDLYSIFERDKENNPKQAYSNFVNGLNNIN